MWPVKHAMLITDRSSSMSTSCGEFEVPIPSPQTRLGTSNSKAALEINTLLVHLDSEVRKRMCRNGMRTSESVH
jgi:hypothetical protein